MLLLLQKALAQSPVDSLEKLLHTKNGAEKLTLLSDLTWEYLFSDISKAEQFATQQFLLAEQGKDSAQIAIASNDLAAVKYGQTKLDDALLLNKRALRIRQQLDNKKGIGSSYNKICNIYIDRTQLDSAIFYGLGALQIFETMGDSASIALSKNVLGNLYLKERDFEKALQYSNEAYKTAKRLGNKYAMMGAAGNISASLQELKRLDEAISWNHQCFELATALDHKANIATATSNLGYIYRKKGDLKNALKNYLIAYSLTGISQEKHGVAHLASNIGGIYNDIGNPELAIQYFNTSFNIAHEAKLGRVKMMALDGLSEANEKLGNTKKSIEYLRQYISLKDSLYTEEKSLQLQDLQTKYDTEKKDKENKILIQENNLAQLENKQSKTLLYGSIALSILLFAALGFYFSARKRKQQSMMQAALVKEKEKGIVAVFSATEEERKRIAKDLHDGVGQQLSGLRLSFESLSLDVKTTQPDKAQMIEKLSSILDDACKEVRNISHQMMPKSLSESGLVPSIDDMLGKALSLTSIQYRFEHFKVDGERYPEKVELGLYRVCQELLNNIIKHSAASEVVVQLFKSKKNLVLIVEDNGKGFATGTKKDGIGLTNITSRMHTVDGEVTWEPGPQQGTVATVRVPV